MKIYERIAIWVILAISIGCFIMVVKINHDQEQYYKYQEGIEIDTTLVTPL